MTETTIIEDRLHSAWLSQLIREHQNICYQYRLELREPVFRISRSRRQLGSWSAKERLLTLSHFLIVEHPWALTIQVLKHEMAHQLCSECFGVNEAGHGELFRRACHQLGLDESFQRAGADLSAHFSEHQALRGATAPGRRIIEKVRKLLALGDSDNEHEAALAMQRACELLERHQLDLGSLAQEQQLIHRSINTGKQKLPAHRKVICTLLGDHFGVRVICGSTYLPGQDCVVKTIELLGPEENVAIAEHCYHFLENRLEMLWQQNRHRFAGGGLRARNSYFLGILAGFRQQLEEQRRQEVFAATAEPSSGLLPVEQAEQRLEDFVGWRFPRLCRRKARPRQMHGAAYQQAVTTGRKLQLRRPVEASQEAKLLGES
ncbi:DUF2786 domain-containing protein [Desulfobulbus rhabdoformis]|uniref:DUF2786 domain-containing protein n=1 Tax=Desulfobulbus rhabdoformis TaxID=34032 RepID=UPI001964DA90|nr:DUF2786 domain-containing protein [Desulfobulbus rhabdoformis]MBM9616536.1 DUF2786 domain-containing protein [Desulfobulbus rhabdoformis]